MPDYRITIIMKYGPKKSDIRHYARHDMEDVRTFFEKKIYEQYSKYQVKKITIERIDREQDSNERYTF